MTEAIKRCTKCGQDFPATTEYFYAHKTASDGLQTRCKLCYKGFQKRYAVNNPEKVRELKRQYRLQNPDKFRQYSSKYRQRNHQAILTREKKHRQENPEKFREKDRQYRLRKPEIGRERRRRWGEQNPERVLELARQRRVRKKNAEGQHTADEIQQLYVMQRGLCCFCSKPVGDKRDGIKRSHFENYTEEHILPLDRGGSNWISNMVLTCWNCNCSRQDKLLFAEWQPPHLLEWMREWVMKAVGR
jgi:hypothetical protein